MTKTIINNFKTKFAHNLKNIKQNLVYEMLVFSSYYRGTVDYTFPRSPKVFYFLLSIRTSYTPPPAHTSLDNLPPSPPSHLPTPLPLLSIHTFTNQQSSPYCTINYPLVLDFQPTSSTCSSQTEAPAPACLRTQVRWGRCEGVVRHQNGPYFKGKLQH